MDFKASISCDSMLARVTLLRQLAQSHRETASKCDAALLPAEYGDYERGKADAYDVCADMMKHMCQLAEAVKS